MGPEGFMRCRNYLGVIGKAEIIVGTEIDDGLWSAFIIESGAGVSGGQQFWLIQLDRPRSNSHPIGKTWRGLKRIIGLARQEIAKAEFCRVLVHTQRSPEAFAVQLGFEGVKTNSVAKVSPATMPG